VIYLDASALVKLIHPEAHSDALLAWLADRSAQRPAVSSALARAEAVRALRRSDPPAVQQAPAVFARVLFLPIDDRILTAAGDLPDPLLRTLDAIHLATVRVLAAPGLTLVGYDKRMLAAAGEHGIDTVAPGAPPHESP